MTMHDPEALRESGDVLPDKYVNPNPPPSKRQRETARAMGYFWVDGFWKTGWVRSYHEFHPDVIGQC